VAFADDEGLAVPLLVGKTVRQVIEICQRLGINPVLVGSGIVLEQQPQAGMMIARGGTVTLRFGRTSREDSSAQLRLTDSTDKRRSALGTSGGGN
jgi:beta-lactam-binding protein with PASTA domain